MLLLKTTRKTKWRQRKSSREDHVVFWYFGVGPQTGLRCHKKKRLRAPIKATLRSWQNQMPQTSGRRRSSSFRRRRRSYSSGRRRSSYFRRRRRRSSSSRRRRSSSSRRRNIILPFPIGIDSRNRRGARNGCSSPHRSRSGARNGRSKNGDLCSSLDFQIVGWHIWYMIYRSAIGCCQTENLIPINWCWLYVVGSLMHMLHA